METVFIELTKGKTKISLNVAHIAYIKPYKEGTLIFFSVGSPSVTGGMPCISVEESYETVKDLIRGF